MSFFSVRLLEEWSRTPEALRLGSALMHFVWQGVVLVAMAWLLLLAMRRARPQVRYAALLVLLGAMVMCPIVTYVGLGSAELGIDAARSSGHTRDETNPAEGSSDRLDANAPSLTDSSMAGQIHGNAQEPAQASGPPVSDLAEATVVASTVPGSSAVKWTDRVRSLRTWLERHRHWFVAVWGLGVALLSLRLTIGLFGAERTRRHGIAPAAEAVQLAAMRLMARMGISGPVRVVESALAEVPTLVGWLRPVILLPVGALCGLTPVQMESLLAHELAHIRRHDYLVNLWQAVVETILFYHPAVWWISRRIREEREHCCDDVAVAVCGDRVAYARALTAMEEWRTAPARWVVAASGGSLAARIRRVIGRPEPAGVGQPALAGVVVVMFGVAIATLNLRDAVSATGPIAAKPSIAATESKEPASNVLETDAIEKPKADPKKPWSVHGRIVGEDGKPMPGVVVTASTGMGTLHQTGRAESDADGKYAFNFGPGILFIENEVQLQAATITAHKPGFSEKNLSRQGDLLAAHQLPVGDVGRGKTKDDVVLPGQPRQIDFTMVAAAKISGRLIDEHERPLEGYSVSLQGDEMPPSSSVVATTKTDGEGRFALADIPTDYRWQFLIEPARREPPWVAWASGVFCFKSAGGDALHIRHDAGELAANRFEVQVVGAGINWKQALEKGAAQQKLNLTGASLDGKPALHVANARLILNPTEGVERSDVPAGTSKSIPVTTIAAAKEKADPKSKTNLKRTSPDAEGRFTITFENPAAKASAKRMILDPTKNQVIFQVFVKNADGKLQEKIFKQLPAQKAGPYRVNVQVKPEFIEHSQVSLTFVTIQPDHDQWVRRFFHEGKGTSYKGMWLSDGGKLPAVTVDEATTGWIDDEQPAKADGGDKVKSPLKDLALEMIEFKRNQPDDQGRFTISFDNPLPTGATERMAVEPGKNEVIFQLFVRDAEGKQQEKIFKQVPAQKAGPYRVKLQLKPESMKYSQMTLMFVTIQPDHDQWVKQFFQEGKGKSDQAIRFACGGMLPDVTVDEGTTGWLAESEDGKPLKSDGKSPKSEAKVEVATGPEQEKAAATDSPTAAQILKMVVDKNRYWLDPHPARLSYTVIGSKPEAKGKKELINRVQIAGDKVRWDLDAEFVPPANARRAAEPMNYTYIFTPGKTVCLRAPPKVDKDALSKKQGTHALRQGMLFSTAIHVMAMHGIPEKCRIVEEIPTTGGREAVIEGEFQRARGVFGLGMDHVQLGKVDWRIDKFRLHVRLPDGVPVKEEYFDPMTGAPSEMTVSFGPEYLKIGEHLAPASVRLIQKRDPAARRGAGFREWILEGRFQNVEGNWLLDKATNTQDGTVIRQLQVTDISTAPIADAVFDPSAPLKEEKK